MTNAALELDAVALARGEAATLPELVDGAGDVFATGEVGLGGGLAGEGPCGC